MEAVRFDAAGIDIDVEYCRRMVTPRDATSTAPAHPEVAALVTRFLTAFEDLDLDAFVDCFATAATAFFPAPEPASRADGRDAIRARFAVVFAGIRAAATSGPPFHRLAPEELLTQVLGDHTAVVSFHLRDELRTARRTLVLERRDARWAVAHLHASNATNQ